MNTRPFLLFSIFATILLVVSCHDTEEYLNIEQQNEVTEYDSVFYTISATLIPMDNDVEGTELKKKFIAGDAIKISNFKVLAEPSVLLMQSGEGTSHAIFSGYLKLFSNSSLTSGVTKLTASLVNYVSTDTLYNDGEPMTDIKLISSLSDFYIDKYSSWRCDNYTYNSVSESVNLVQQTVFVDFDFPIDNITIIFSLGKASFTHISPKQSAFAVPIGTLIESAFIDFEESLGTNGQMIYKKQLNMPKDCIPYLYSVGENKKILFSRGNLQYRPIDQAWRLAPNQYDVIKYPSFDENYECDISSMYELTSSQWIDLFGWGTWMEKGNPLLTSLEAQDYANYTRADGFLIGNSALGAEWKLLSLEEWHYLLFERPDAYNKVGLGFVNQIGGMILLPDKWSQPDDVDALIVGRMSSDQYIGSDSYEFNYYNFNDYSISDWHKMEDAGAVFLPIAGRREGTVFSLFYGSGSYWTVPSYYYSNYARVLYFELDFMKIYFDLRNYYIGSSVRLVRKFY